VIIFKARGTVGSRGRIACAAFSAKRFNGRRDLGAEEACMRLGDDLKNPAWMYLKAALFLGIGLLCAAGILVQNPSIVTAVLLALAIWAFCRLYYFMFYVIERYVDPGYRFAGLGSFVAYLFRRRKNDR
jgi:hypothetical protein